MKLLVLFENRRW